MADPDRRPTLGWIGVGRMGLPIVEHLVRAGFTVLVHDRDASRTDLLKERHGIASTDSPVGLARQSDVILSMVNDDDALRAVALGRHGVCAGLSNGKIYIDLSTVSPTASAEVAAAIPPGPSFLRAPVSGSVAAAEAGRLTVYCSGPDAAYETSLGILQAFSAQCFHVGDQEEARLLKLLINAIVVSEPVIFGEAIALGLRGGLKRDTILDALDASVVASPLFKYKVDAMRRQDWAPAAALDLAAKDADLAIEAAATLQQPLAVLPVVRRIYAGLQEAGQGDRDFFAISDWPHQAGVPR